MSITDLTLESKATRWGEAVIASAITRRPIRYISGSTFNEAHDVLPLEHMGTNKIPAISHVALGIGSDRMESLVHPTTSAVIENPTKYIHSNSHAIPFIGFPYIMRREGEDDLSREERAKYAIRSIVIIKGVRWVAYYLKASTSNDDNVGIDTVTVDSSGSIINVSPLEPSSDPLNPVRDPNFTGEAPSTNEFLRIRSTIGLKLSPAEVAELLNCAAIIFGSTDIEITEFAMVAGIPHSTIVNDGGTNITYDELIGAQSTHFSATSFSAAQRVDVGVEIEFKIGQSLPMA